MHTVLVRFEWNCNFIFLVRFYRKLNFLYSFSKNKQIPNFMKICPLGAELFHMDGQVDRHGDASSRYSQFSKAVRNTCCADKYNSVFSQM